MDGSIDLGQNFFHYTYSLRSNSRNPYSILYPDANGLRDYIKYGTKYIQ